MGITSPPFLPASPQGVAEYGIDSLSSANYSRKYRKLQDHVKHDDGGLPSEPS